MITKGSIYLGVGDDACNSPLELVNDALTIKTASGNNTFGLAADSITLTLVTGNDAVRHQSGASAT